uniref:Cdc37 Hsp90 binding domain-containing protein n=1 Tax=Romanomermis culicivorax TaxID=13658 RepID=A0A915KPZ9_ROMCU
MDDTHNAVSYVNLSSARFLPSARSIGLPTPEKKFVTKNSMLLKKFGMLNKWDDSKQFLLENPHLCCEETANHLVLQCLEYEMDEVGQIILEIGFQKHDLMEHVAHQTIIIQYLLELASQLKVNPKASQLISSFFSKLICFLQILY